MSHKMSGDCFAGACEICNPPKQYEPNWKERALKAEAQLADRFDTFEEWKASVVDCKELADSIVIGELKAQLDSVREYANRCGILRCEPTTAGLRKALNGDDYE